VLLVGLLLATATLCLAPPDSARWAVTRQIETETGRQLAMAAFDIDVPRRRIHVAGFRLADREPGAPLLEFDTLDVRFRLRDLLRGRIHLREITLAAPRVRIVRTARGVLNVSDLLERPAEPTGPLAPFTLDRLPLPPHNAPAAPGGRPPRHHGRGRAAGHRGLRDRTDAAAGPGPPHAARHGRD